MTGAASLLAHLYGQRAHLAGWGYTGVGGAIAAAVLAALAGTVRWTMRLELPDAAV
ncbi:MAG: hypothetical protein LBJ02_12485 [Bifidobacteriaceae bacterium]|nr:hypothetical protein [Bifidobacteriaceae bacterium]